MEFSVAYNWDPALFECLVEHGAGEIYAKFDRDITGGARPAFAMVPSGWSSLRVALRLADRHGIRVNYVLNGVALGAEDFSARFRARYQRFVRRLADLGVQLITVANPWLAELTRAAAPRLELVVSSLAHVRSLREARFWEAAGARVVIIDETRNARLIRAVRAYTSLQVEVIANHLCWDWCPLKATHSAVSTSASREGAKGGLFYPSWCDAHCQLARVEDPAELVRASWIRPQDLSVYERWGATRLKICERLASTEDLCRIVGAYRARRFEGDLVDLFPKMRATPRRSWLRSLAGTGVGRHLPFRAIDLLRRAYERPRTRMDAEAFDGFLQAFERIDCRSTDCASCGHCEAYARRAVRREIPPRLPDDLRALMAVTRGEEGP
jgi:collagenase-like PrtC family protease